jgi:membrane protein DedA with SNARE-associated domain
VNALLIAKFVPGLATIAPPLAGATRISWPRFLVFNMAGGALWVAAGLGLGIVFSTQIERALVWFESTGAYALGVVVALLASATCRAIATSCSIARVRTKPRRRRSRSC